MEHGGDVNTQNNEGQTPISQVKYPLKTLLMSHHKMTTARAFRIT